MSVVFQHTGIGTVPLEATPAALRALVHKRTPENVLLTGISTCGTEGFICTGRLPNDHLFFNDAGRSPRQDILFYTELDDRRASPSPMHSWRSAPETSSSSKALTRP